MYKHPEEAAAAKDLKLTRGQRLWERELANRHQAKLSLWRAKLLLASYQSTEGQPAPLRRAKAFEKIVTGIPIYIEEDDLIAGSFSARPMDLEWYPEYAVDQEMADKELDGFLGEGHTVEEVREIIAYFKDRSLQGSFLSRVEDETMQIIDETSDPGAWVYRAKTTLNIDRGYHAVDYRKAIEKGFSGVLREVEAALRQTPVTDDESYQRRNFLRGLAIMLKAGIQYGQRHAALARTLAKKARGLRKRELMQMAEICERVPAEPARSFREAVQTACFLHILMHLECRGQESPGRMDQYLYPYYQRDIKAGLLTREEALEVLECLRVKMSSLRLFNGILYNEIVSGEAQYHNVTLGGQTPEGADATNELSYLFLEAASLTKTPHPTLSIRVHDNLPEDFAIKGLELVRSGLGFPAFFNDEGSILWLMGTGAKIEEARDYCLGGCVSHIVAGKASPMEALFFSFPKCLELAMHDGFDPRTKKQLGPKTGKFADFKTFEDLLAAYRTQVKFFAEQGATIINEQRVHRVEIAPTMLASAFIDDCIEKGKSCASDGARLVVLMQVGVGMIDTADSLAAIKKCVYEDRTLTKEALLEALALNFEGRPEVRKMLLAAPKYGNDDDFVDAIAADLYNWWRKMVSAIDGPYGVKYIPAPYSVSAHGAVGKRVGALPSGRLAWAACADGSVSPCTGMDAAGPTAVMNSAGKIDQAPLFGTLLNMKFHPAALKTREDLRKLYALIRTYFHEGGKHVQFNVVDKKTLLDAQKHPEAHRNLIVRVAGYSAHFVELNQSIQEEIIHRTEHAMMH